MKKGLLFCIGLLFLCSGCKSKAGTLTCTRKASQGGVDFDLLYTVNYKGEYVTSVNSIEKLSCEDGFVLYSYQEDIEYIYEPYKELKYYDYDVKIEGNTLISETNIDYTKVNTKRMIEIDESNANLIRNGHITVDTLEAYYQTLGVVCE